MKKCALCQKEAELEISHIIPKFVYRALKKNSPTGNIRLASDPNRVIQDGDKQPLLCGNCEDLFNETETKFANQVFHPYHSDNLKTIEYGPWLNHFITSVNWRNLYLDITGFVTEQTIDIQDLQTLIEAEKIMRQYLLGERNDLGYIENHVFFFSPIKEASDEARNYDLHSVIGGSVFGYTFLSHDYDSSYVFLNFQGIIIVTITKRAAIEEWENTFVHANGTFDMADPKHYVKSPLFSEFQYLSEERKKSQEKLSEKQKEKIVNAIGKNRERFMESKAFKRLKDDERIRRRE